MKKCELFPVMDEHQRKLKQLSALTATLNANYSNSSISEAHYSQLNGLSSDIVEDCNATAEILSEVLSQLYIINNAVNGKQD